MSKNNNLKSSINEQPFKMLKGERESKIIGQSVIQSSNFGNQDKISQSQEIFSESGLLIKKKEEKTRKKQNQKIMQNETNIISKMKKELVRDERINQQVNNNPEYDQIQFAYTNDGFTYQANQFIRKITASQHAKAIACKYPLYKMIKAIAKKFLFNELEIIFFGYILEEYEWQIQDERVKKHSFHMQDFLNINEASDPLEYKSVLLFLVLNAYAVKFYLNPIEDLEVFSKHLENIIGKNFKELFGYWSKQYASVSLKIIPKKLNQVFRKLSAKPIDQNKKIQEDYNSLVDAIIQISPPYNSEKIEEKQTKKEVKSEIGFVYGQQQCVDQYQGFYPFQQRINNNSFLDTQGLIMQKMNSNNSNFNNEISKINLGRNESIRLQDLAPPNFSQQPSNRSDDLDKEQLSIKYLEQNKLAHQNSNNYNSMLQLPNFSYERLNESLNQQSNYRINCIQQILNNQNSNYLSTNQIEQAHSKNKQNPNSSLNIADIDQSVSINQANSIFQKIAQQVESVPQNLQQQNLQQKVAVPKKEDIQQKNNCIQQEQEEELEPIDGNLRQMVSTSLFFNQNN